MTINIPQGEIDGLLTQASDLRVQGRSGEAAGLFRRALMLAPASFDAGFGLAMTMIEAGDRDGAEKVAAHLLKSHPGNPGAAYLAGRIAVERGDHSVAVGRLEALIGHHGLAPEQRAEALLLLSHALDSLDRTHVAFVTAAQGKAIQRAANAQRAAAREGEVAKLNRLAAWFENADPADWAPAQVQALPGEPSLHVFLVGFRAPAPPCWSRCWPATLTWSRSRRRRPWPNPMWST